MDINFSQVSQSFAQAPGSNTAQALTEGQDLAVEQEKLSDQAKVVQPSAEKKIESRNQVDELAVESAAAEISEFVLANNRQLNFSVDEGSNKSVVRVTDSESGEIIRQIPSEEVLRLSERLKDLQSDVGAAVGVLFNKQV